jgi:hypothetical protein
MLFYALAAAALLAASPVPSAQDPIVPALTQGPGQFKDVPADHWAYQAVENRRSKGILQGYPDGAFGGKRIITRNEFAVTLDRAMKYAAPTASIVASPAEGYLHVLRDGRLKLYRVKLTGALEYVGDEPQISGSTIGAPASGNFLHILKDAAIETYRVEKTGKLSYVGRTNL